MSCPSSEFFHERAKRFDGGGCQRRNVVGETATRGDHYGTGETCDANAYRARPNAPRTGCHPSVRTASSSDRVARSCISVSRPENHDHRFQHTFLSAPFFFTSCAAAFRFVLFARLKSRAPYPISFFGRVGLFGFFRPRKIPALYSFCGLTRHTRIKYSVLREAQPRNARDLRRLRALAVAALFRLGRAPQLHAPRRSRAMSARTGWKRTADGRMMRSESAEDVMEQDQPSMLLDRVPAHVLREVFGFLGDSDLARAEATCATFRQASRSESLWRDKLADKLGDQAKIVLPEKLPHERCVRARRRLRPHRISSLFFSPPRQRPSRNATRADLLLVARAGTTTAKSWRSPPGRPCSSSG